LRAVAYNQGKPVTEDELRTAGRPSRIELSPERTTLSPSGDDVITITATAVDDAGVRVPDASAEVQFTISGPAQIVATDNGSNTDHESFLLPQHRFYGGRLVVLVRATAASGAIRILASSAGLADGNAQLTAVPPAAPAVIRSF
jgi:beta-galactosidase